MNKIDKFIIPGKPIALKRHRTVGKIHFDPQKKEKSLMASEARKQMKGFIRRSKAIEVEIAFHMHIPKSWSKKRLQTANGTSHIFTPDLDNLVKFVFDALNLVLWDDDCIICELHAKKEYSDEPRTEITIRDMI